RERFLLTDWITVVQAVTSVRYPSHPPPYPPPLEAVPVIRARCRRSLAPGPSETPRQPRPRHLAACSRAERHLHRDRTGLCDRTELSAQDPVHGGLEHLAECLTSECPDQHHQSRRHQCHQHPSGYVATLRCGQCLLHVAPPPALHHHTSTLHRSVSLSSLMVLSPLMVLLFSPDGVSRPSERRGAGRGRDCGGDCVGGRRRARKRCSATGSAAAGLTRCATPPIRGRSRTGWRSAESRRPPGSS